jgi:GH24 family phage-related lysozyme (muramidase)/uncharacterized protein YraI
MKPTRTSGRAIAGLVTVAVLMSGLLGISTAQASTAAPGTVHTAGPSLTVRSGPSSAKSALRQLRNGTSVHISCQTSGTSEKGTYGTSRLWDKLSTGGYVADVFIYTGSDGRVAPDCAAPATSTKRRLPKHLSMSGKGLTMLTTFEGSRLKPYNDSNGYCTVGVGHLLHTSRCTSADHRISAARARSLLTSDVKKFSSGVTHLLPKTPLRQYEFDVLVSFAFNIGLGGFRNSKVWEDLHRSKPNYKAVPAHLLNWTKTPCGAHSRRINEGHIFATGSYKITNHC